MPRAVLFDFNGVLVDDEPLHLRLLLWGLEEEGLTVDADWARHSFLGIDDRSCLRAAFAQAGRTLEPVLEARLLARKAVRYRSAVADGGYPFFPAAGETLAGLAASGLVVGVVSGALRGEVEGALAALGVRRDVALLVTAEDVALGKPDPAGYLRALELLQRLGASADRLIHPHEVVAVEDSPAGLAAATAAGLRTLTVVGDPPAGSRSLAEGAVGTLREITSERLRSIFDGTVESQVIGIRPENPSS